MVLATPPSGVFVRKHAHGLELVHPWRQDNNALGNLLQLGIVAFLVFGGLQDGSSWFAFVMAAPLAYSWLYTMLNHTTVLIAPGGVEVVHGPLPSFSFGTTLAGHQLRGRLHIQEVERRAGRGRTYRVYHLETLGGDTLLKEWNHRESLDYVRYCIEQVVPSAGQHDDAIARMKERVARRS